MKISSRYPKNVEGLWFSPSFISSTDLVCSQIWVNHLMNDHHFSYITKLKKQKKQKKTLELAIKFAEYCSTVVSISKQIWH
jgi:hypothetical protein